MSAEEVLEPGTPEGPSVRHAYPLCPVKRALTNCAAVCQEWDPATNLDSFLCAGKLTQALHLMAPSNVMEEAALRRGSLIHGTPGDLCLLCPWTLG